MAFRDVQVYALIDQIREHYHTNLFNHHFRLAFSKLNMTAQLWERIDTAMDSSMHDKAVGYSFREVYELIHAMAVLVHKLRNQVGPDLRAIMGADGFRDGAPPKRDTVLRDMAISNFPANVDILANLTYDLYIRVLLLDKEGHKMKPPVYTRMREISEVESFLNPDFNSEE